jgi:nickel-dependent lactate racemase
MQVNLPQLLWYENTQVKIDFPDPWSVFVYPMKGSDSPKLTAQEIEHAFRHPIGTPTIAEIAKSRKEAVIIFDDLARPTPTYAILPYVLRALAEGGIPDSHIRLIAALGAHGALNGHDFRKKLGDDILLRFPIFNHNAFGFCTYLGETSRGTPLWINSEVMACDLKIGIGSIVPHIECGYGGGAKIILPGVAHMDTIMYDHGVIMKNNPDCVGFGKIENNVPRLDIEEAARIAGLDVKIDVIVNLRGEMTALFVGDPVLEHREGVKVAKDHYATEQARDMDIVVVNAYSKSNEAFLALQMGAASLRKGGDLVLIANEPAGQSVHYLHGKFGKSGNELRKAPRPGLDRARRLIAVMPFRDPLLLRIENDIPDIVWVRTWQESLDLLKEKWGEGANVAVYPDATVQYFPLDNGNK